MACSVCLILLRKILLEAVAILSFSKYSWPIGLQIVLVGMHGGLGTHGMRCCLILWQNVLAGGSWNLSCVLILKNQIANCFVRLKWCALFFFRDSTFFLQQSDFWAWRNILASLECRLFCQPCVMCTICSISLCKFSLNAVGF